LTELCCGSFISKTDNHRNIKEIIFFDKKNLEEIAHGYARVLIYLMTASERNNLHSIKRRSDKVVTYFKVLSLNLSGMIKKITKKRT
jgi:hypothetical protein